MPPHALLIDAEKDLRCNGFGRNPVRMVSVRRGNTEALVRAHCIAMLRQAVVTLSKLVLLGMHAHWSPVSGCPTAGCKGLYGGNPWEEGGEWVWRARGELACTGRRVR